MNNNWSEILSKFISQAHAGDLKTATYPKEWAGLGMRVSFGMGTPARIPWVGLTGEGMAVSRGINPVYLYYKDLGVLVLAYGVSETEESPETWPAEILNSTPTIEAYFDKKVPRYGDSFVFKAYKVDVKEGVPVVTYAENSKAASPIDLESDLNTIVDYYKKVLSLPQSEQITSNRTYGLFYMEKQLEDFIIHNWENTELGKKYDLIIEEGVLLSQQYRTDIGPIDILAKDKETGGYVVIELKKDQTSDDTVGQVARYMGWVKRNKNTDDVKGVIIAGQYDQKLDYALGVVQNVEVFLYEVNFKLNEFIK
jgi:hypothetical protein